MDNGQLPPSVNGQAKRPLWLPSLSNPLEDNDTLNLKEMGASLKRYAWLILLTTAGLGVAGYLLGRAQPVYVGSLQVLARTKTSSDDVIKKLAPALNAGREPSFEQVDSVSGTKIRLLSTEPVLKPVSEQLNDQYPKLKWWHLATDVKITPITGTSVLKVEYSAADKEKVKTVLTALGQAYVAYSLEEPKAEVQQAKEFLDSQLPALENRVSQLQNQLQDFRQSNSFYEPASKNSVVTEQLSTFRKQLIENQVALEQAVARYQEIQTANQLRPGEGKVALALTESTRYQRLLQQLATLDNQIAERAAIFQPNHEEVMILRDQRSQLLPALEAEASRVQAEAASRVQDLSARKEALLAQEAELTQDVKSLGGLARRYADIQRNLTIATTNLNQLSATRSTLDLNTAQRQTPWEVIAPVIEPKLTSVMQNTVLGAVAGLALGSLLALLADRSKNVYYSASQIKQAYKYPVLATIPHNRELGRTQPMSLSQAAFASNRRRKFGMLPFLEALRSLQTNLRLLNADQPIKSVVISSATPEDGKSTIAAYLAQVAGSMGNRVLLVDAEMRRPQIHHRMGLQSSRGLSDLLVSNASPREYIIEANDNVDVLTAGQLPPDPIGLLSSQRMQQLMDQFARDYDVVIYDTPPLAGFADAHLVATKTDGLLLVSRVAKTNRDMFDQVIDGLGLLPTKVLGLVINDSKQPMNQGLYSSYYDFQDVPKPAAVPLVTGARR
ncbi:polysaccharide biosynthesis tyrosine autokinase [filamentous cyanobacterium LEGE 11480]|uniref:Polysaccharide biosynthesis tyrosine autokinase n=1 Tax=Romeriopsis navalis LEGE 11480 TaxID=2777977 RepID=A0A928VH27_9CYAN|nr:polysaccharide biosynthesis tyrosine autokinase [Romeriopsis navalis]MBE9028200.1 polysaccharide biosynthesis tyrosine autokinase [Romeriopsis navalis LEGE 11480]